MKLELLKHVDPFVASSSEPEKEMYKLYVTYEHPFVRAIVSIHNHHMFDNITCTWKENMIIYDQNNMVGEWFIRPLENEEQVSRNIVDVRLDIEERYMDTRTMVNRPFHMRVECGPTHKTLSDNDDPNILPSPPEHGLPVAVEDHVSVADISPRTRTMLANGEILPPTLSRSTCYITDNAS